MATLATAISSAITKSLLAKLPAEAATKFDVDEAEFKEFLQDFLTNQLGKTKGVRTPGPKGKNGKGRLTGYILFSNTNRDSVKSNDPTMKFTDVGKELGRLWKALSDEERADWGARADQENMDNGIPTPTPAAAAAKKAPKRPAAPKAGKTTTNKIVRHQGSNTWTVQGTNFVVQSPKNKAVVGKLRGNKVVALSPADLKKCEASGLQVKPAQKKTRAVKPVSGGANSDDEDSE